MINIKDKELEKVNIPLNSIYAPVIPCVLDGNLSFLEMLWKILYHINVIVDGVNANHGDIEDLAQAINELDADKYIGKGEDYSKNLNRSIIEDKCRAYILDKADEIGAELSEVTVTAQWSSDGYWYPHEAEIVSSAADDQKSRLSDYIQTQLGISISDQNWSDEANDR